MSKPLEVNKENFAAEVLNSAQPVLVDFWAPWCMPCKMMGPILDEMAMEMADKVKIAKVDIENPANQELAAEYQIQNIPNMKLFKDGKVIAEFIGLKNKETLKADLGAFLQ
ncbi:TPA: thioredoxin [Candidatus Falkowbacteria bacterium]|nr:thioredoxin [Candidatus Falkowbacteria bacterium]